MTRSLYSTTALHCYGSWPDRVGSESKGRVVMGTIAVGLGLEALVSQSVVAEGDGVGGGGGEFYNVMEGLNLGDTPTGYAGHLQ